MCPVLLQLRQVEQQAKHDVKDRAGRSYRRLEQGVMWLLLASCLMAVLELSKKAVRAAAGEQHVRNGRARDDAIEQDCGSSSSSNEDIDDNGLLAAVQLLDVSSDSINDGADGGQLCDVLHNGINDGSREFEIAAAAASAAAAVTIAAAREAAAAAAAVAEANARLSAAADGSGQSDSEVSSTTAEVWSQDGQPVPGGSSDAEAPGGDGMRDDGDSNTHADGPHSTRPNSASGGSRPARKWWWPWGAGSVAKSNLQS